MSTRVWTIVRKNTLISFVTLSLVISLTIISIVGKKGSETISSPTSGSFHLSQRVNNQWVAKYTQTYTTEYETHSFKFTPHNHALTLKINEKNVPYADIDFITMKACESTLTPASANYLMSGINILEDINKDDKNVVIAHENPIIVHWNVPSGCNVDVIVSMKANEYESPEENAFRFPQEPIQFETYHFKHNGSLTIDGNISEVDDIVSPNFSPFWKAGTGHPSNKTYIYMKDDSQFVYLAVDISLDNTNEFGDDWLKIFIKNAKSGGDKEYRIDDFTSTYGSCSFGLTSTVSYKHAQCEVRIPKKDLVGDKLDFILRYYGTGGGSPTVTISNVSNTNTTIDTTPSVTGKATGTNGGGPITAVAFNVYDNLAESYVVGSAGTYPSSCTSDDGTYDENVEDFTCTAATLDPGYYTMNIRATGDPGVTDTDSDSFFLANDLFDSQINTDGFGSANNSNAYSMVSYNGLLYVGTENTEDGPDLWSYDGDTWTEVDSSDFVNPVRINALVNYNSSLLAVVQNETSQTTAVWSYNGSSWTQLSVGSYVNTYSTDGPITTTTYNNNLYVGTRGKTTGRAEVWKYDGSSWTQSGTSGFGDANNSLVSSLVVYNDNLYAGIQNLVSGSEVWKFNGTNWTEESSVTSGFGTSSNLGIYGTAVYNDILYASAYDEDNGTTIWSYDGNEWNEVMDISGFGEGSAFPGALAMVVYNNKLFLGGGTSSGSVWIYDGDSWYRGNQNYFDNSDSNNAETHSLFVFNGVLYAGNKNQSTGSEIWATTSSLPSVSLTPLTDPTTDSTPALSGTTTDSDTSISSVEFQVDSTTGSWTACTSDDGTFDEASEAFACTAASALANGSHTMYVRSTDAYDNVPEVLTDYSSDTFTVSVPTPTSTTSSTSSTSVTDSGAQLTTDTNGQNSGQTITPHAESEGYQKITIIVDTGTLHNSANAYSNIVNVPLYKATSPNSLFFNNPITGEEQKTGSSNSISAGSVLGIDHKNGAVSWSIGKIVTLFYKTKPPQGSDKPPAIIIPELQDKPSNIALTYTLLDLIPPGQPYNRFSEHSLRIARSRDGKTWEILKSSVVDPVNHTVAAIDKVFGYYTIVSLQQNKASGFNSFLPTNHAILGVEKTHDSNTQETSLTTQSTTHQSVQLPSVPTSQKKSILEQILSFVKSIFN